MARHRLPAGSTALLAALLDALTTDPAAPTTVRTPAEAVDRHLADSLVALDLPLFSAAHVIVDLGSGAGLPGLALAAGLPGVTVHLLESSEKKCHFMRRAAQRAGLPNAEVVHARAETVGLDPPHADVVTARAVGPLALVAEYAAPILDLGGHLVAWTGRRDPAMEREAARAAEELGLELVEVKPVRPYPGALHRHLHVYRKVSPTPDRFPRRPGVAHKHRRKPARTAPESACASAKTVRIGPPSEPADRHQR